MKPILNTTASLLKIPQLDLAYNKKKLAEWRNKENGVFTPDEHVNIIITHATIKVE